MTERLPEPVPRRPPGWSKWSYHGRVAHGEPGSRSWADVWSRGRLMVLSSVDEMDLRGERRPQWLVSVSSAGRRGRQRPTDDELARALRDFGMEKAEEDNHEPGVARKFFLLVDARPQDPPICECKETEETVREPDGYAWQKDRGVSEEEARAKTESLHRVARLMQEHG